MGNPITGEAASEFQHSAHFLPTNRGTYRLQVGYGWQRMIMNVAPRNGEILNDWFGPAP